MRIRIRISDKRIRIQEVQKQTDPKDPGPQHCLNYIVGLIKKKFKK